MDKDSQVKEDFTKIQSKEHSSNMRPYDAMAWIAKQGDIADVKITDPQIKKILGSVERFWRTVETGIKNDLKKEVKLRQLVVEKMIVNCIRCKGGEPLRVLMENTMTQVMLLSRLESRWKSSAGKFNKTYEAREKINLIIE